MNNQKPSLRSTLGILAAAGAIAVGGVAIANKAMEPRKTPAITPAEALAAFKTNAATVLESSTDKWLACGSPDGDPQEYHASDIGRYYDDMAAQVERGTLVCSGPIDDKTLG